MCDQNVQLKRKLKKLKKMKLKVSYKQHKQIPMTNMSIDYFILGKKYKILQTNH